jgi:hypothetical protein
MPGVGMPILNTMQPIIGVDIHNSLPPVPPAPAPHVVVWMLGLSGWMNLILWQSASKATTKKNEELPVERPVLAFSEHSCARAHDAGPHLGHFAANALLAVIWAGASSKCEFGSGTVRTPADPMGVNMMFVANLQLDCADPIAMPTSVAITIDYTIKAGFTWMDLLNGVVHMVVDLIIDALIGVFLGGVQLLAKGAIDRVFKKYALIGLREAFGKEGLKEGVWGGLKDARKAFKDWRIGERLTAFKLNALLLLAKGSASRTEIPKELGKAALDTFIGLSAGGPTGADMPYAPYAGPGDWVNETIDGWFYGPQQAK